MFEHVMHCRGYSLSDPVQQVDEACAHPSHSSIGGCPTGHTEEEDALSLEGHSLRLVPEFRVGDKVEALYAERRGLSCWCGATLEQENGDGSWTLRWDDNDPDYRVKSLQEIRRKADFIVGEAVEALYPMNGGASAWYGATIQQDNRDGSWTVRWDDGDAAHRTRHLAEIRKKARVFESGEPPPDRSNPSDVAHPAEPPEIAATYACMAASPRAPATWPPPRRAESDWVSAEPSSGASSPGPRTTAGPAHSCMADRVAETLQNLAQSEARRLEVSTARRDCCGALDEGRAREAQAANPYLSYVRSPRAEGPEQRGTDDWSEPDGWGASERSGGRQSPAHPPSSPGPVSCVIRERVPPRDPPEHLEGPWEEEPDETAEQADSPWAAAQEDALRKLWWRRTRSYVDSIPAVGPQANPDEGPACSRSSQGHIFKESVAEPLIEGGGSQISRKPPEKGGQGESHFTPARPGPCAESAQDGATSKGNQGSLFGATSGRLPRSRDVTPQRAARERHHFQQAPAPAWAQDNAVTAGLVGVPVIGMLVSSFF